jgi:hypothetical protein
MESAIALLTHSMRLQRCGDFKKLRVRAPSNATPATPVPTQLLLKVPRLYSNQSAFVWLACAIRTKTPSRRAEVVAGLTELVNCNETFESQYRRTPARLDAWMTGCLGRTFSLLYRPSCTSTTTSCSRARVSRAWISNTSLGCGLRFGAARPTHATQQQMRAVCV